MRGVGTAYVGLVLLLALVSMAVYIVYMGRTVTQAIHEQQQLYEHARFIAEHSNITDSMIELPELTDIIVVDPQGIPHVARNVQQLQLPWPASKTKIYVVKTGRLRVGAADPVASSIAALASVAAAPLYQENPSNLSGATGCDWYLDPVLYSVTGDPWKYRGYVPVGNLSSRLSAFFGLNGFFTGASQAWRDWLAGLGLPDPGWDSTYRVWQAVYCGDYGVLVAVNRLGTFYIYRINTSGTFILSTGSSYSSSVEYWSYRRPRWDLYEYTLYLSTPSCFAYIYYLRDYNYWFSSYNVTVVLVSRSPSGILYVDSVAAYTDTGSMSVNVTAPAVANAVAARYSVVYNTIYSHPTTYTMDLIGVIYSRC